MSNVDFPRVHSSNINQGTNEKPKPKILKTKKWGALKLKAVSEKWYIEKRKKNLKIEITKSLPEKEETISKA